MWLHWGISPYVRWQCYDIMRAFQSFEVCAILGQVTKSVLQGSAGGGKINTTTTCSQQDSDVVSIIEKL